MTTLRDDERVAVRRVDRDQVALGLRVSGHEPRDARAEQTAHRVGADPRVTVGSVGYERGTDIVHEPRDLELDIVGRDFAEPFTTLQRVREEIDVFFVGVRRARGEHGEQRVDVLDRVDGGERIGAAHSPGSGGGGRYRAFDDVGSSIVLEHPRASLRAAWVLADVDAVRGEMGEHGRDHVSVTAQHRADSRCACA